MAHWPTAGEAAAGTALGAVAEHCPEHMGVIYLRAPEPQESGRGGALPESCGACTAQLVRPWRAGPGRERQAGGQGPGMRCFAVWGHAEATCGAPMGRGTAEGIPA